MSIGSKVARWTSGIAALLVAGTAFAQAADGVTAPFLGGFLKETRVVYPLQVGEWQAQGEHLYEQQALGASVRYVDGTRKDRWIDLYFYPAGALPPGRLERDVEGTLEEIRSSAGRAGGYSEVEIAAVEPLSITLGKGKGRRVVEASSVAMRLVRDGKAYSSAMVMLATHLYYVKARFSAEESAYSRRQVQNELDRFVAAVLGKSTIRSNGGCWMPLPIVRKDALERNAAGQLATSEKDGTLLAVAYADRVEALDAQSAEAAALQSLSMPLLGRSFEGCGPPEDMNPAVPAGMRELRLEYTAPDGEGRNPSIPMRPADTDLS